MNTNDSKLTALQYNQFINDQDLAGLASMMPEYHIFIDRVGEVDHGKATMLKGWVDFFRSFPAYRNTFTRVQSDGYLVVLYGYATWQEGGEPDWAIWTARIEDDLVAEWRIYEDNEANRVKFGLE